MKGSLYTITPNKQVRGRVVKIICISKSSHKSISITLSIPTFVISLFILLFFVVGSSLWYGHGLGLKTAERMYVNAQSTGKVNEVLQTIVMSQKAELGKTKEQTSKYLDTLALQLGNMQSHVLRLNALGEWLTELGKLDAEEFNFSEDPALGGIESVAATRSVELSEIVEEMQRLALVVDDREHKLVILENLIRHDKVEQGLKLAGKPAKGWISSDYGYRTDPFSGKKGFHHGIDIAGKKGSEVRTVASGVVIFASKKNGYGNMVEILHANGYTTKYGHNSKNLVKVGDLLSRGDVIGLMGSTGRSTGPHVHFEIAYNGKRINPNKIF